MSLSARRAWIEIFLDRSHCCICNVALRKESVDRNIVKAESFDEALAVALRKESVDRNWSYVCRAFCYFVALRKESVDRNKRSIA